MHKKITATRQAAFLKALAETGNQTLAAERAKVSRSWVLLHRKRDAGFDAAVREACAGFARRERDGTRPPRGWGHLDGVALVVRGTGDGIGGRRRVQIARARLKQWDAPTEDRFLHVLAATCNVKAACAAVGLTQTSAYEHRKRWPAFGERWDMVVMVSSERIECSLLRAGHSLNASDAVPVDVPITGMTAEQALMTLRLYRQGPRQGRHPAGRPPRRATIAETCEALEKAIARFDRQKARRAAREARGGARSPGEGAARPHPPLDPLPERERKK